MKQIISQLSDLAARVQKTWQLLALDNVQRQITELKTQTMAPEFWQNQANAKNINQKLAELEKEIAQWQDIKGEITDALDLAQTLLEESDNSLHDELLNQTNELAKKFEKLEFYMLFADDYDKNNAILSFHAGSGGTEAQDWAEMLLRMITRFAQNQDWQVNTLHISHGQEAGIKSATVEIKGRYAYGYLQSENGVHRLVRISPFDAEKMRHTSFALIEVLPEIDESIDIKVDDKDLRIDTFMAGGHGGQSVNTTYSAVRIVHIPTNITVTCQNERSQKQNREMAMKILKSKLHLLEVKKQQDHKQALRGEYKSAEWSNQIRSYVLHPYKQVKDHRTDYVSKDPDAILDGQLQELMESYLRYKKSKQ